MRGQVQEASTERDLPQMRGQDDSHCARGQREEVPGGLNQGGRGVWGEQLHQAEAAASEDGDRLPLQE